ncbi:hypothetical protein [uncultured Dialister sp.]|uniref:hypothetical protein n=1 Tax=uncultured Dialister sp. TaxID=278064 RepID=UPI0025FFA46A|nr:hypothetical protein [uncultured Dialister sp.]
MMFRSVGGFSFDERLMNEEAAQQRKRHTCKQIRRFILPGMQDILAGCFGLYLCLCVYSTEKGIYFIRNS